MNRNTTLQDALKVKDISAVHSYLYTVILSDPGFRTGRFDMDLKTAVQQMSQVLEPHNGEELKPQDEWSEEYYDLLTSKLIDNFSQERIDQLKKVARIVYPTPVVTPVYKSAIKESTADSNPKIEPKKNEATGDKTSYFVFLAGIVILFGLLVGHLFRKD